MPGQIDVRADLASHQKNQVKLRKLTANEINQGKSHGYIARLKNLELKETDK